MNRGGKFLKKLWYCVASAHRPGKHFPSFYWGKNYVTLLHPIWAPDIPAGLNCYYMYNYRIHKKLSTAGIQKLTWFEAKSRRAFLLQRPCEGRFHLSAASAFKKQRLSVFHVTWFFSFIASWRKPISSLSLRSPSSSSNGKISMLLERKVEVDSNW